MTMTNRQPAWTFLIDDYEKGTVFITDDPKGSQRPLAEGLDESTALMLTESHNAALAQASQLSEARTAELVEALRHVRDLQPKALAYIESQGFVFDVLGPLSADASELDEWKVLAFSLYTDLCEANSVAVAALAATDGTAPDAEREE